MTDTLTQIFNDAIYGELPAPLTKTQERTQFIIDWASVIGLTILSIYPLWLLIMLICCGYI